MAASPLGVAGGGGGGELVPSSLLLPTAPLAVTLSSGPGVSIIFGVFASGVRAACEFPPSSPSLGVAGTSSSSSGVRTARDVNGGECFSASSPSEAVSGTTTFAMFTGLHIFDEVVKFDAGRTKTGIGRLICGEGEKVELPVYAHKGSSNMVGGGQTVRKYYRFEYCHSTKITLKRLLGGSTTYSRTAIAPKGRSG